MNPLLQRFIDIAINEVGEKEQQGHPNTGPDVEKYQRATTLPPGPWPWCAAFVAWCMKEWLRDPDVRLALKIAPEAGAPYLDAEAWRFKSARAFDLEDWGLRRGMPVLIETELGKAGDLITYDFSHCGILTADEVPGQSLWTCEGNTNDNGSRDGDGVYRKRRPDSLTRKYIRLL